MLYCYTQIQIDLLLPVCAISATHWQLDHMLVCRHTALLIQTQAARETFRHDTEEIRLPIFARRQAPDAQ